MVKNTKYRAEIDVIVWLLGYGLYNIHAQSQPSSIKSIEFKYIFHPIVYTDTKYDLYNWSVLAEFKFQYANIIITSIFLFRNI